MLITAKLSDRSGWIGQAGTKVESRGPTECVRVSDRNKLDSKTFSLSRLLMGRRESFPKFLLPFFIYD